MSDIKREFLKVKLLHQHGELLQNHAAAIGAFCVANDIELEIGVELALEVLGEYGRVLLETGAFDKGKEIYANRMTVQEAIEKTKRRQ